MSGTSFVATAVTAGVPSVPLLRYPSCLAAAVNRQTANFSCGPGRQTENKTQPAVSNRQSSASQGTAAPPAAAAAQAAALARHPDACRVTAHADDRRQEWLFRAACLCFLAVALHYLLPVSPSHAAHSTSNGTGSGGSLSSAIKGILDFALHLDKHLGQIITAHGQATYAMLFAIVFAETGFVLTPFLPGDSLLFAAGAFSTPGSPLSFPFVLGIFLVAAILGDAVNYAIGSYLGQKALSSNLIKAEYITKTQAFYTKYGGKTIVLARFVPIVRTFAPFVAGVAKMSYRKFAAFNIGGAVLWTTLFTGAGYFFGNLPFVKENFTLVILAIVLTSVLPVVIELANERRKSSRLPPGTTGIGNA